MTFSSNCVISAFEAFPPGASEMDAASRVMEELVLELGRYRGDERIAWHDLRSAYADGIER